MSFGHSHLLCWEANFLQYTVTKNYILQPQLVLWALKPRQVQFM